MLNDNDTNNSVNIKTSCIGTLQKSHPKSYFVRCFIMDPYFEDHIENNPCVLQIMIFSDSWAIVEILPQSVYDEWVKERETKNSYEQNRKDKSIS